MAATFDATSFKGGPGPAKIAEAGFGFCLDHHDSTPEARTSAHFLGNDDLDNDSLPKAVNGPV